MYAFMVQFIIFDAHREKVTPPWQLQQHKTVRGGRSECHAQAVILVTSPHWTNAPILHLGIIATLLPVPNYKSNFYNYQNEILLEMDIKFLSTDLGICLGICFFQRYKCFLWKILDPAPMFSVMLANIPLKEYNYAFISNLLTPNPKYGH